MIKLTETDQTTLSQKEEAVIDELFELFKDRGIVSHRGQISVKIQINPDRPDPNLNDDDWDAILTKHQEWWKWSDEELAFLKACKAAKGEFAPVQRENKRSTFVNRVRMKLGNSPYNFTIHTERGSESSRARIVKIC